MFWSNEKRIAGELMIVHKRLYETSLYRDFSMNLVSWPNKNKSCMRVDRRDCIKVFKTFISGSKKDGQRS